jgi:hypothetical protein
MKMSNKIPATLAAEITALQEQLATSEQALEEAEQARLEAETISLEVNRFDLISMIKGTFISYEKMEIPIIAANGNYVGGFSDRWSWNYSAFEENTLEELLAAYQEVRA